MDDEVALRSFNLVQRGVGVSGEADVGLEGGMGPWMVSVQGWS